MEDAPVRGAPSNVRGWLSEVYLPALVAAQSKQLMRRLGERATVDDPILGRSTGTPDLPRFLERAADWLRRREASFENLAFTTGSDRDVTEGTLSLVADGKRIAVPVAVVAERRPAREVEIRLYYSTRSLDGTRAVRTLLVPRDDDLAVPPPVAAHLNALLRGDVDGIVASFGDGATVRDADGVTHRKEGSGGPLRAFYERLLASRASGQAGVEVLKGARADDGSTCALEYTVARAPGRDLAESGLAVYERGDNGLLSALRLYHDDSWL
ncbi:MAG: hypothetical protein M3O46_20320 [Myxococcota bacterium]|nr:hypothetical protein [Myxococcota bacterium]